MMTDVARTDRHFRTTAGAPRQARHLDGSLRKRRRSRSASSVTSMPQHGDMIWRVSHRWRASRRSLRRSRLIAMCLVIVALAAHPRYALVVAANRDEFHARAALPAQWGRRTPLRRDACRTRPGCRWYLDGCAARRALGTGDERALRRQERSSGTVARRTCARHPRPCVATVHRAGQRSQAMRTPTTDSTFWPATLDSAFWMSNRASEVQPLSPGIHGLSNAQLDTPWPKLSRTKGAITAWAMRGDDDLAPVFAALADRTRAADADLPATGVSLEWERLLSSPFIASAEYGTRCSTVLAIARNGTARFVERSFDIHGNATGDVEFEFEIRRERG